MQAAGQPQVSYTFDNANRLTQIAQSTSTVGFSYDNANRRSTLTLPNGIVATYSYDNDWHLTGISYTLNSTLVGALNYGYDTLGMRTSVSGSLARTELPQPIPSASYDAGNELLTWNETALSYDANGNMLSDGAHNYAWDERNHLAAIDSRSTGSFVYDPAGRRATKVISGTSTSFLCDLANPVQELSGIVPTANLLTGGLDEYFSRTDAGGTANFLTDALGSTTALTDANGTIEAQYMFDPFGNTAQSGVNTFSYTGRENDGTGLYYNRARYYNPTFGRFISQDPVGFRGHQSNLYAYVGDSPTNLRDPFGLWGWGGTIGGNVFVGGGPGGGLSGQIGFTSFSNGNKADFFTQGQWMGPDGGFYGNYDNNQTGGGGFGFGPGLMLTNGNSAQDLSGPFNTTSYTLGLVNIDFAYSPDTGVWTVNFSGGFGLGFAKYCTNTYTLPASGDSFSKPPEAGRNCGCNTGYLPF
jgi:RHS repeat-associated protein